MMKAGGSSSCLRDTHNRRPFVSRAVRDQAQKHFRRSLSASATETTPASTTRGVGRMTYRPASYAEMVKDAVNSILEAVKDGEKRLEVEFPPVPLKIEGYKSNSDLFIDSNVQLALAAAKLLAASGKRTHVVMPDNGEYIRTYKMSKSTLDLLDGISLGHLNEGKPGLGNFSIAALLGGSAPDSSPAAEKADVYIVINASCVELPNIQQYMEKNLSSGSKAAVIWNLELDTLRGDLGLISFPPKDMHYNFLSTILPVFFLRPRDYSKSVPVAPFIVNYSGALFREYPGPWQVMLKQDNGEYACIAEDRMRYNLGDVKEEMQAAMGLNTEAEGSTMQFLRRGNKTSTWWEEETEKEVSNKWRS
ncbi:hypothetical protein CEUSTIGMA_g7176.t1 [Chlamydomonas eustigma]|uniref:DUF1995 domain-containing protein n=1 Tax=Chlamydomonas eustigma TaxID=1157962 RepID=A0A250X9G8_9CHLO|nr:hypothetical protein CEUSTIGMA_g7176.t1 [Chlamydomonas eustigma]|eukprot:GAX79735.1 hypothetical protein CEUSTIGMA_g7176.t1 [Chlamydomonas eustigma]